MNRDERELRETVQRLFADNKRKGLYAVDISYRSLSSQERQSLREQAKRLIRNARLR